MNMHLTNIVIIFIVLIIYSTQAQRANDCLKQGFQQCLDNLGQCTSDLNSCSQNCNISDECEESCCLDGYCLKQELCQTNISSDQRRDAQLSKKTQKFSLNKFLEHLQPFFFAVICLSPIFCYAYCKFRSTIQTTVIQYEGEILNTENEQQVQEKSGQPLSQWQKQKQENQQQEQLESVSTQEDSKQLPQKQLDKSNIQGFSLDCSHFNASVFQHDYEKQICGDTTFCKINQQ
ncbi:transmembrane protein, putative (macronuclear) [Tetrahymena thermophila SB210]|uniref:Transmembrane protein, putative n=1 Tax=Tetrahymena thermophila (strain SB210) TaxID=312017 RepID=W7X733_TETTS|nr:transmembrane protein, putative [Tetrahymena thermophila SB210]EWS75195.1 transmembrane protein, putative [Tetrahymena thermophila SB210]|eukprot:XP_012652186.1 transmembrane protein, putative [Tetrahymena thermophila SB210]